MGIKWPQGWGLGWEGNDTGKRLVIKMDENGDQSENGDEDGMETRWACRWGRSRG